MATKTFNDICVEYAHQLGKGLPLTAPEMCNALVMYLNQQVTDMNQMVQTALNAVKDVQDDIAEGEYATLGANNVFRGSNSFSQTVQANGGITINGENVATENDIPSYTEFSGVTYSQGEGAEISYGNNKINLPIIGGDNINIDADSTGTHLQISAENVVELNTNQTITGIKTFSKYTKFGYTGEDNNYTLLNNLYLGFRNNGFNNYISTKDLTSSHVVYLQDKGGTIALLSDVNESKIPTDSYNEFLFNNPNNKNNIARFYNNSAESIYIAIDSDNHEGYIKYQDQDANINYYSLPKKTGVMALTSDIPNLDDYTGTIHIAQGTAGGGVVVHDTVVASPYTKYGYDKIETYGNSNALKYTLNIPNKNGTIATLDDISSTPSPDKYFTRVIYHSTDDDTQYVIFSCITDTNLSANTTYQNVIDLLNNLGATSNETALPCTGKTVSGGILVGVYTDGTNIIVFDTDNSTEELNMSAEIKFISK